MVLHASFYVCLGFALVLLAHMIVSCFAMRRTQSASLDDALRTMRQIMEEFAKLQTLQGKEREALCKHIAAMIRQNCKSLISLLYQSCPRERRKEEEIGKLAMAAHIKAVDVHWKVTWILILRRVRPNLMRDCRRLAEAALQHSEMWMAFLRLLRAQYPAELGQLELPE